MLRVSSPPQPTIMIQATWNELTLTPRFPLGTSKGVINVRTAYPRLEPRTRATAYGGIWDTPGHKPAKWWDANNPIFTGASFNHAQQFGTVS